MYNQSRTKTLFESTKTVVNSVADIFVTGTTTGKEIVQVGGKTVSSNLKAMYASTVRVNSIDNSMEVSESFDVTDNELDKLEEQLKDNSLTTRQKERIQDRIDMWEETARVVKTTSKL